LDFNGVVASLGTNPSPDMVVEKLRNVEPLAACFYSVCETVGLNELLPRTSEQAGATYYIMSLILFVIMRFVCTGLMKFISPRKILSTLAVTAVVCCLLTVYGKGIVGVYALVCITGCMSLMFPTIYGIGIKGLGDDTKIGGAGMVMAIAGAAVLTQIQAIVSDSFNIKSAYWIPTFAFAVIAYYSLVVCKKIKF
jgi:FHS family L-fucose permease-like MFS transporter